MNVPRISASSYSNTAPLVWSFLYGKNYGKYELISDNAPARSAELLRENRIDAALVPVIEYQRRENILLVPDVCVGSKKQVKSVCLITKGEDLRDVKSVALDISSKTSVALTKIIFREFLGFEPIFRDANPDAEQMLKTADCALLIGDPALSITDSVSRKSEDRRSNAETRYRKFDLVELWREFTGFGFVFAMWMANFEKREIARRIDFAAARDEGLANLDKIISNYENIVSVSREDFLKYLSENISYSPDESMHKGLELYFQLAYKNNLTEKPVPLRYIGD